MQPTNDSAGGDGIAMAGTGEAPLETAVPIQGDVSATPEELNLKIEQELGLPHTEVKTDDVSGDASGDEKAGDTAGESGDDSSSEETGNEEESAKVEETRNTVVAEPTDKEFFIEVEDADGVTHKISQIEDLPEDFVAKNNRQGYEILRSLDKLDRERDAYQADQVEQAAIAEKAAADAAQFDSWDREIAELGKGKRIDSADSDKVNKVFEHMNTVNKARIAANNPNLITSFEDALDKFEAFEAKNVASDKKKAENERAKSKASLIGGSNSTGAGAAQPYYSGRYRSMDDVPV